MKIILTHEQADFDAIASLLAAHLLEESAKAILPRRINRNVSAYLTLYGVDLPFIDPRDVPKGKIESVTLVDTQSLVSLKGMDTKTKINVVDHHSLRPGLPEDWRLIIEKTGAATTILVEAIQERGISLSLVQATLLMLGIYEDTGALTYTRTNSRDVRAAAFLLEQGANLQIVGDFLNHPLSPEQQELYTSLKEAVIAHQIGGANILLASGEAKQSTEELSSIAHKLRDLLDPDALILLITTAAGVQMVARATTDQVDVGKIAKYFGGGGHRRAAAALIQGRELENIQSELLEVLPEFVQPLVTVDEIMSRGPQVVSPETPVSDVGEQMRRYGYEGYLVVEDGKVIGLITRRAVDRTLAHKLKLKTKDVMSVGTASIFPNESIEALQKVMTDTGWGQIPVIDPGTEEIIGIVTRTDILKILTPQVKGNGIQNVSDRLESRLSPSRLVLLKAIAELAEEHQHAVYIVGGFVRDLILDRPSQDYDLVVEGDAIELGNALVKAYGGRVITHKRFGTAKWWISKITEQLAKSLNKKYDIKISEADFPASIDLITARREFYSAPTVLPTVEQGSIKLDLHRRDFTINTLALRLDGHHYGELHDYWGGMIDLKNGVVRVLHSLSFVDDPTRILRAIRFEKRFDYEIESRSLELLENALPLLAKVSGDRVRHELNIILQEENAMQMLARLESSGTLAAIHPNLIFNDGIKNRLSLKGTDLLSENWQIDQKAEQYPTALVLSYLFWLYSADPDQVQSISKRLKLPAWLTKNIIAVGELVRDLKKITKSSPGDQSALFDDVEPVALFAFYLLNEGDSIQTVIDQYLTVWRNVRAITTGHDLRAINIPPGPQYQKVLNALRTAWINGEISSEAEEKKLLETLLRD